MTIATVRADGWPQATIVGYANEGWSLYFLIYRNSQKFENIARDKRVAITVGNEPDDIRQIKAVYAGCEVTEVTDLHERSRAWDTSGAEELQRRFPQAKVVGAFKNVFWEVFDHPEFGEALSDVLITGNDDTAKAQFLALAAGTPFRYLDAGALINSRTVERLTMITGSLGRQLNSYPRMNWRLLTQPEHGAMAAAG